MSDSPATTSASPAANSGATGGSASQAPTTPASGQTAQAPAQQTTASKPDYSAAARAALSGQGPKGVASALQPATPAPAAPAPSNPQEGQVAAPADDLGLSPAQIQALKRAQAFDPELLAVMPLNNRKAFADRWAAKLADNDRRYQQQRQSQNKPGTQAPGQPADKADASQQQPGDASAETPESQQEGQPSQSQAPTGFDEQALSQFVLKSLEPDDKEAQTLVDQFGEDGVKAIRSREQRLVSSVVKQMGGAMQQAFESARSASLQAARMVWDAQFKSGVAALKQQPGFESIDTSPQNLQALRNAIIEDARKANDPEYSIEDAVARVAASVFKVDPRLAAQVAMTKSGNQILSTSGARPSSAAPSNRPISPKERQLAAARAALAGQGPAGVSAAMQ